MVCSFFLILTIHLQIKCALESVHETKYGENMNEIPSGANEIFHVSFLFPPTIITALQSHSYYYHRRNNITLRFMISH